MRIYKRDIYNLFHLTSIQAANAVLPLFIYPYILSKLGSILYSKIAIAETISIFILTFALYGFEIDGVSMVLKYRNNPTKNSLSQIFCTVFYSRILIFSCCLIPVAIVTAILNKQLLLLTLSFSLIPAGHILQSSYFYLGLEKNNAVSVNTAISRIICLALIIIFIKSPSDFYKAPCIIGATYALGGLLSLIYIIKKFKITFVKVPFNKILGALIDGKEIFMGNLSTMLYRDANILILGLVSAGSVAITAFSIANKLTTAFQAVARPLNQLFFPKTISLLKNMSKPSKDSFKIIFKMTSYQLGLLLLLAISLITAFVLARYFGYPVWHSNTTLRIAIYSCIMLFGVFAGVCNFMFGSVGLNYLSMRKYYFLSMLSAGIISVVSGFILAKHFGGIGASINFVLGETVLATLVFYRYFYKAQPMNNK